MRILSQSGMIDLPYESIGVSINYKNNKEIIVYPAGGYAPDDGYWIMAEYSSQEKAQKAMELLHKEYKKYNHYLGDTDDFVPPKIFKFPADDETGV